MNSEITYTALADGLLDTPTKGVIRSILQEWELATGGSGRFVVGERGDYSGFIEVQSDFSREGFHPYMQL